MSYVKWTFILLFWGSIAAFLHYTLPQHDVARITDTEVRRIDPGMNSWFWASADSGTDGTLANRDVFFISAVLENGRVMVYRNEDTSWGWPPYLKFDTSNLQAEAADAVTSRADPEWYVIRHYGWRSELLSSFPNAVSIRPIEGPDAKLGVPWLNVIILTLLAAFFYAIWVRWRRFRASRIDPVLEDVGDGFADASDAVTDRTSRLRRWLRGT